MKKVLVTGANGFVGRSLCSELLANNFHVRATTRTPEFLPPAKKGYEIFQIGPIGPDTFWSDSLAGIDTVIHLAARVHQMKDSSSDPLGEYLKVNTDGTVHLAREAVRAGVRRFIFVSTVKVHGEGSLTSYAEESSVQPADFYGISKLEAEKALRKIADETGLELIILRPTLIYGPGVKANFLKLIRAVQRGVPLPFGSVTSHRSLLYVGNLVDIIVKCINHPSPVGRTYLVSDGKDVSVRNLCRMIGVALGKPARLVSIPSFLIRIGGKLAGKSAAVDRLTGSLTVDTSRIRRDIGWIPPFTMEQGLKRTVEWFQQEENCRP